MPSPSDPMGYGPYERTLMDMIPRLFELIRTEDESGVSGTGVVAEGVKFSDGTVALRWKTEYQSTAIYESIADVNRIHGHNGKTEVVWL